MLKSILPYWLAVLFGMVMGVMIGASVAHTIESRRLLAEQAAHARDNQQHANDLNVISKAALAAEQRAIAAHRAAGEKLAALDAQLIQEKHAHETDNARHRAAIADGQRRLRVAVSHFRAAGPDQTDSRPGARAVGNGARGTAELPPAFGYALFQIADDADADARAKADYLQHYVRALQQQGVIAGTCAMTR